MYPLSRQLQWYIALRVVVVVTVLLAYSFLGVYPETTGEVGFRIWLYLGLPCFAATLLYIVLLRLLRGNPGVHAYIQFFGDLLLVTALVYSDAGGGIPSPFSTLYLIIIAVAATLLRRRAGVIVATAALVLYALPALFPRLHLLLRPGDGYVLLPFGPDLFNNLVVHGFGFYAMAFLTSYLAHNITRAERELEEKSEHLADLQVAHRDVIQSIGSGLITTDLDGVITSVNQAGLAILERPETGLVGTPIQESGLFSAERWGEMTAASEQRRKLRSEVDLERGGDIRPVGFSISQLTDAEGTQRGYIVVFQDLSRWRRMQEELRMKDRMAAVGELAAGLAHEIGNPLAAISGSVQMLSSSLQGDPAQRKLLEILLKESQRLDRTIKGFLRFARPRERSSVAFDVARLLAENFELLKNSEEVLPGHQLELALDPPSARLLADPDQMSQIFWNVTRNSLRAMPGGGTLRVVGRLTQDTYCIEFMDTGRGMSEEQRANLFHPFQSFFDGGTGIGMAIVYRIVQDHGGRLHVDSRPGVGTTISVELPADAPGTPGADEPLSQTLSAVPAEVP
ncbi:MAG TPA: ATP-binding protein [Thermoanaerobaculia bacterium]|nr:ATP-binding protein [Thermoanaerobaculia bacterium]